MNDTTSIPLRRWAWRRWTWRRWTWRRWTRWIPLGVILLGGVAAVAWIETSAGFGSGRDAFPLFHVAAATTLAVATWLLAADVMRPVLRAKLLVLLAVLLALLPLAICVEGYTGDRHPIFALRFARQRQPPIAAAGAVLAETAGGNVAAVDFSVTSPQDFPGFRGPQRNGVVVGAHLARDWSTSPVLCWRQPIGRGWSSFAAVGRHAVTLEQRGAHEAVICLEIETGRLAWSHEYAADFQERMGGDGPRATPTIQGGCVYSLGATGVLCCFEGSTGQLRWSRDVIADVGGTIPRFGVAASPLVVDGRVIVCPGGVGSAVAAYDARSGQPAWQAGDAPGTYSSPQLAAIGGKQQIITFNNVGVFGHDLSTGAVCWSYPWPIASEYDNVPDPCPLEVPGAPPRVLFGSGYGLGSALIELERQGAGWQPRLLWSGKHLKPKFASFVVHQGFVYGLDENILTCIDLANGMRRWKGGRYGYGQLLLVDDLLLVQAEDGSVALVEAAPTAHRELGRFPGLDARTWTCPALAGDRLLLRNDREAASYALPVTP